MAFRYLMALVAVACLGCIDGFRAPAAVHVPMHQRTATGRSAVVADWRTAAQSSLEEFRKAIFQAVKGEESLEAAVEALKSAAAAPARKKDPLQEELADFRRSKREEVSRPLRDMSFKRMEELIELKALEVKSEQELKAELQEALNKATKRGQELSDALESSRGEVAQGKAEISSLMDAEAVLRRELDEALAKEKVTASQVEELLALNAALEKRSAELDDTKNALADMVESKAALEDALESAQDAEMRLERNVAQLASEKAESAKQAERLLAEVAEAKSAIEAMQQEKEQTAVRCEQLLAEATEAKGQIETLLSEKEQALAQCATLRSEANQATDLRAQMEALEASAKEAQLELLSAKDKLAILQEQETVNVQLREEVAAKEMRSVELEGQLAEVRGHIATLEAQAKSGTDAELARDARAEQVSAALKEAEAAKADADAAAKQAAETAAEVERLKAQLAKAESRGNAMPASEAGSGAEQVSKGQNVKAAKAPAAAGASDPTEVKKLTRQMKNLRATLDLALAEKDSIQRMLQEARREAQSAKEMISKLETARTELLHSEDKG